MLPKKTPNFNVIESYEYKDRSRNEMKKENTKKS